MSVFSELRMQNMRYSLYEVRRTEYQEDSQQLQFRVAESPLKVSQELKKEIIGLGPILRMYLNAVIILYNLDNTVKQMLDNGKPNQFIGNNPQYLFLRPDLIISNEGIKICEIETSMFGLGLADILNKAYIDSGYDTLVSERQLKKYVQSVIPEEGVIAYSKRVKSFSGQLKYLAEQVFSGDNSNWKCEMVDENFNYTGNVYRAFYTSDCMTEQAVNCLVNSQSNFIPSLTPQFEEKAILSLIWDKRYKDFFKRELGKVVYDYLRKIIPPTFVLGQEKNFEMGLPGNVSNPLEISKLPKSKRQVVLKKSSDSSWGEGIKFLHKLSHDKVKDCLQTAMSSNESYIIQDFFEGRKILMNYNVNNEVYTMQAKVRITPYYAFSGKDSGKLIAIKATGCENTDYIHGATNSINTAVMA